ncbi:ATPase domain-containing protein [Pyxidicoccus xibeiensis]|uniref:ATPase domain-containing protein n=1 Tax=Pyxidicoccus xibeiensis TaxID=2906759 RepID=UPI0020A73075|nr:ATPase domain-containing protein [Pyxidicoccus xibeiensis]MCP3142444.1 AAA family ATPase [Pyxidicoccus xibeiensis]
MDSIPPEAEDSRLSSSTPHLDPILGGGWLRGGLYILTGPPGTGKTTLANQMCFNLAKQGVSSVYVTMLTETHARMVLHLRSLAFFQQELVGTHVHYVSGVNALKEGGARALLELLSQVLRDKGAQVLVIDGFNVVREHIRAHVPLREFLQSLSVRTSLTGCTTFLISSEEAKTTDVEHVMADGILSLQLERVGLKAIRGLEVIKFRGSNNLSGRHTLTIDQNGVCIFPRYEALHRSGSEKVADPSRRSRWGIPGLDAMCGGGLVTRSSTLLLGSPGGGKTLLGLHFLAEGAASGEPGLYFGFGEGAAQLLLKADSVGLPLRKWVEAGRVHVEVRAPVETLPDSLAQDLVSLVEQRGCRRLLLDGLESLVLEASDAGRTMRFLAALLNTLRDRDVTVLLTQQPNELFGPELHASIRGVEALADNVLFVRFFELSGRLHRLVSVLKMRDSDNDPHLRELAISSRGLEVRGSYAELDAVITGQPRPHAPATARSGNRTRKRASPPAKTAKKQVSRPPRGRKQR